MHGYFKSFRIFDRLDPVFYDLELLCGIVSWLDQETVCHLSERTLVMATNPEIIVGIIELERLVSREMRLLTERLRPTMQSSQTSPQVWKRAIEGIEDQLGAMERHVEQEIFEVRGTFCLGLLLCTILETFQMGSDA